MLSIPVKMSPKSTWITLKQALGLWMMLGYQQQPSRCLPMPSERMPGTSCCKQSTRRLRKRGGNLWMRNNRRHREDPVAQWKFLQWTNVLNLSDKLRKSEGERVCLRVCLLGTNGIAVCRWTHSKCSGLTETDVGYTAWLSSRYIIRALSPFFINLSPPTLSHLFPLLT